MLTEARTKQEIPKEARATLGILCMEPFMWLKLSKQSLLGSLLQASASA